VKFLKKHDAQGRLRFTDIRAVDFQPLKTGVSMEVLEKQIHAVLPDGSVISRMEVIRAAYREIGLGWLAAPTGWPLLRPLFDRLYGQIAKHRMAISRFFK
jgi:predicted DCC family thiol-disulfide oxidoreductase YuxK